MSPGARGVVAGAWVGRCGVAGPRGLVARAECASAPGACGELGVDQARRGGGSGRRAWCRARWRASRRGLGRRAECAVAGQRRGLVASGRCGVAGQARGLVASGRVRGGGSAPGACGIGRVRGRDQARGLVVSGRVRRSASGRVRGGGSGRGLVASGRVRGWEKAAGSQGVAPREGRRCGVNRASKEDPTGDRLSKWSRARSEVTWHPTTVPISHDHGASTSPNDAPRSTRP